MGITFLALAVPWRCRCSWSRSAACRPAACPWPGRPGAALALNAILVAASAPVVMPAISGRQRRHVRTVSQACMIAAFAVFLLVRLLPAGAAIALVLIAVLPLAVCEVMQAAVVPAIVTESATPGPWAATHRPTR